MELWNIEAICNNAIREDSHGGHIVNAGVASRARPISSDQRTIVGYMPTGHSEWGKSSHSCLYPSIEDSIDD